MGRRNANDGRDKLAVRLTQILKKLNDGEPFCIKELASEFGVSKRTIERDLFERFAFLPIDRDGGKFFLNEKYLGKLSPSDIRNFAVLSGIKGLFPNLENGFLTEMLDARTAENISVRGHHYEEIEDKKDIFVQLQRAISEKLIIEFRYSNKHRVCEPYKLINNKGIWYIAATQESETKSFSLSKISDFIVTNQKFEPDIQKAAAIDGDEGIWYGTTYEITIEISADVAGYFRRRNLLPNQRIIKELEGGGLLVSSNTSMPSHVAAVVRYWIPHLKIISPQELQNSLIEELKRYMAR